MQITLERGAIIALLALIALALLGAGIWMARSSRVESWCNSHPKGSVALLVALVTVAIILAVTWKP